jgi:hypothetical protein
VTVPNAFEVATPEGEELAMLQQRTSGGDLAQRLTAVALAFVLASCGGSSSTTPTPTPTPVTDVFNGTMAAGGSTYFPFTVTTAGTITSTLLTLTPQTTITMGFGIGQLSIGVCTPLTGAYTESAKMGQAFSGTIGPGNYCVLLYDVGNIQGSDDFVISVMHT